MKALYIICTALLFSVIAYSQSPSVVSVQKKLDSLKMAINKDMAGDGNVASLKEITQLYFTGYYQLDSAKKYATMLNDLSIRTENQKGLALSQYYLGRVADGRGDYARAISYSKQFLESEVVKTDSSLLANGLYSLANIYIHQGDLEEALNYQLQVLRLDEASGDQRNIGLSLNNLGIIMKELNRNEEAIKFLERALSIFEKLHDKGNMAMALSNLGGLYSGNGTRDKALQTFQRSLLIYKELGHDRGIAIAYQHIGSIERNLGQYQNALKHIRDAIAILQRISLKKEISESYYEIALVQKDIHEVDSVRFFLTKSLALAQEVGDKKAIRRSLNALSDLEAENGNYEKAYFYFKSFHNVSDSILNESIANRMTQLETKYEVEKQETEISNLKTQQKLNHRLSRALLWALIATAFMALMIISFLFYRGRINRRLLRTEQVQKQRIKNAYDQLKATQAQLIQAEKMASLGELTAGIAHEIQNPLNFVNNFSEVSTELLEEIKEEIEKGDLDEVKAITEDVIQNLGKILHHGKRADGIVKGMLLHSRDSSGQKEPTDINALADEYLRLSYHGFRAKDKSFNTDFKLEADESLPKVNVVPQDIGRVLLNLINNAFYAVSEKSKLHASSYKPQVIVNTISQGNKIEISVKDNGNGIPESVKDKIFQPFFTTKPTGQGTGLGLSLSYDIVKALGGELNVETSENGSEFIIQLPIGEEQ